MLSHSSAGWEAKVKAPARSRSDGDPPPGSRHCPVTVEGRQQASGAASHAHGSCSRRHPRPRPRLLTVPSHWALGFSVIWGLGDTLSDHSSPPHHQNPPESDLCFWSSGPFCPWQVDAASLAASLGSAQCPVLSAVGVLPGCSLPPACPRVTGGGRRPSCSVTPPCSQPSLLVSPSLQSQHCFPSPSLCNLPQLVLGDFTVYKNEILRLCNY